MARRAIVLCSGGLDSVVTSYYVKNLGLKSAVCNAMRFLNTQKIQTPRSGRKHEGFPGVKKKLDYEKLIILFFNYKQKSRKEERKSAKKCAKDLDAEFREIELKWLGDISTSLINTKGDIKELKRSDLRDTKKESEKFYVPCRNTVFLAYALALAESLLIREKKRYDIFVGFKCEGKESYPDTTKEFVEEINKLSKISTRGFRIIAPLIKLDKEEIILLGKKLNIDLGKTFSCYAPKNGRHCGFCLACMLRKEGFYWANLKDETRY